MQLLTVFVNRSSINDVTVLKGEVQWFCDESSMAFVSKNARDRKLRDFINGL
jgi:hypothetical protein